MRQTELTQDPSESRRWILPGVGTFLRTGRVSRAATAEAGDRSWKIVRYGLIGTTGFRACDETGAVVGELRRPMIRRGETFHWRGRDVTLRYDRAHRAYVLLDGGRLLATLVEKKPGKRPLDVAVAEPVTEPGLLLFAAFIVQAYADDASFPPGPSPPTS